MNELATRLDRALKSYRWKDSEVTLSLNDFKLMQQVKMRFGLIIS